MQVVLRLDAVGCVRLLGLDRAYAVLGAVLCAGTAADAGFRDFIAFLRRASRIAKDVTLPENRVDPQAEILEPVRTIDKRQGM